MMKTARHVVVGVHKPRLDDTKSFILFHQTFCFIELVRLHGTS